jgi:Tol biopolymer transport system component
VTVGYVEAGQYAYVLQRAQVDSAIVHDLMTLRTADDCAFFVPAPDGSTVYFGRKPADGRSQVWSISLTTFVARQLTTDGGDYPAVSPNGQWVVYTNTNPNEGGLWLMRKDGSDKRRLTRPAL